MFKYFLRFLFVISFITQVKAQSTITFTTNADGGVEVDAYIHSLPVDAANTYSVDARMPVLRWTSGGTPFSTRAYFKFDVSSISSSAHICSAYLTFFTTADNNQSGSNKSNVASLKRATSSWNYSTVSWNVQPSLSSTDSVPFGPVNVTPTGSSYTVDVTSHIQSMVTTPSTNYGWVIKLQNETDYYNALSFASSNAASGLRPYLTVTYVPNLTVTPTATTICSGQSTTLTVSGATSYSWTPSTGLSATTGSAVVSHPTTTVGLTVPYTVTGTTGSCQTSTIVTVNVNPTPTVSVNSPTICAGGTATLTASGASTYSWSGTGLITTSGATVTANPTVTTTYTTTGTSSSCTGTKTSTVTVNALPTLTITPSSSTICAGATTTLTASGASTYSWTGSGLSAGTGTVVTAIPSATTIYTLTGTNASGCVSTKTISISVSALPTLTITASSSTICAGATTTLTASGASTYSWTGIGLSSTSGTTVTATPSVTSTYTLTGTNGSGCVNTGTVSITVNALPTLSVSATSATICVGATTTLTASGASTYSWTGTGLSSTSGTTVTATPSATSTYTLSGTNGSGCVNTKTVTITVNALPTLSVSATSATICVGSSSTATVSGASTYTWSPAGSLSASTGSVVTATPTITTNYTITATNSNGCVGTKTVTLNVNPLPTLTITPSTSTVCVGSTTTLTASGASTYSWTGSGLGSTSGTTVTATPGVTSDYTITGTDANGCVSTKTISIATSPTPTITVNSDTIYGALSTTLTAAGGTTYSWSPSTGLSATTGSAVVANPTVTTTYTIIGTTGSCTSVATSTVTNLNLYFRSKITGNWGGSDTWESSPDNSTWSPAAFAPNYKCLSITIQATHTVTIAASVIIDETVVNGYLKYNNSAGNTLSVNDGTGVDLTVNGVFADGGPNDINWLSTSSSWIMSSTGSMFRNKGTSSDKWRDHYNGGISTIPATSSWIIRKTTTDTPILTSTGGMYYPNLIIDNVSGSTWTTSGSSSFTDSTDYPRIKGSLTINGTGANSIIFTNQNKNTHPVLVQGDIIVNSGSTLQNNGTGFEIQGNVQATGSIIYGTSNNRKMLFSGSNAQTFSGTATNIYALQINKPSNTLTLNTPISVDNTLILTAGNIITTTLNILTIPNGGTVSGASSSSFISGPVKKIGNTAFTFPTGKGTNYQPIGISAPTTTTDAFTAEYINAGQTLGNITDTSLARLSTCEYWNLGRTVGTAMVNVTLGWNNLSCNVTSASKLIEMHLASWNSSLSKWNDVGEISLSGNTTAGAITSPNPLNNFNAFTLANENYLPLSINYVEHNIEPNQIANSGYIAVSGANGLAPYKYVWEDNSTSPNRYNLQVGTYSVMITDSIQDTLKKSFTVGSKMVISESQNITDSLLRYTNSIYPNSAGSVIFANTINAGSDGWMEFSIKDTTSNFFIGFGPASTDSSSQQNVSGLTIQTSNKYISRVTALQNPSLLATYDTLSSSYSDSIKVIVKKLVNSSASVITPLTNLNGINFTGSKMLVLLAGSSKQKSISILPGDVFRIGTKTGSVYVQRNAQNLTLTNGTNLTSVNIAAQLIVGGNSVTFGGFSGSFSPIGIHITRNICLADFFYNTVQNTTYDENGQVTSESKTYYDGFGRTLQNQARLLSQNNTLVTQNLYDGLGRAVGQTLPAPDFSNSFCYQPSFVTSSLSGHSNQSYSYVDFDMPNVSSNVLGQTNNPSPIANSTQGSLGWYYSNNNTTEPYVAASGFPYNRVEYYPDPTGRPKTTASVGEAYIMGSGHESNVFYMCNGGELDFFYGNHQSYEVNSDLSSLGEPNENLDLFKTVTVNPDGKETIAYSNASGKTIASCISGSQDVCVMQTVLQPLPNKGNGSIVIHLPKSQNNSLSFSNTVTKCPLSSQLTSWCATVQNAAGGQSSCGTVTYNLTDVSTGKLLVLNTDYTFSNGKITFINGYQNKSLYLRLSYNYTYSQPVSANLLPELAVQYKLDYSNWSLNFYDPKDRLITNISPNDVNCQGTGQMVAANTRIYTNVNAPGSGNLIYFNGTNIIDGYSTMQPNITNVVYDPSYQALNFPIPNTVLSNSYGNLEFNFVNLANNSSAANLRTTNGQNVYAKSLPATIATPGLNDTLITSVDTAQLNRSIRHPELYVNDKIIDSTVLFNPPILDSLNDSLSIHLPPIDPDSLNASNARFSGNVTITYSVNYNVGLVYPTGTQYLGDVGGNYIYPLEFQVTASSLLSNPNQQVSAPIAGPNPWGQGNVSSYSIPLSSAQLSGLTNILLIPVGTYVSVNGYPGMSNQWFNLTNIEPRFNPTSIYGTSPYGGPASVFGMGCYNLDIFDWSYMEYSLLKYAGLQSNITFTDLVYAPNQHVASKKYTYDNYNRLSSSTSIDEGHKDFVYDTEDKLRFTQNDKQHTFGNGGTFSYVNYDRAARPIETGEYDPNISGSTSPFFFQTQSQLAAGNSIPSGSTSLSGILNQTGSFDNSRTTQQTYSTYDSPDNTLSTLASGYNQTYLPGKVSKTWNDYSTSWYSYDELGRLIWTVQKTNEPLLSNPIKTCDYTYNLAGNVLTMVYQKNGSDFFGHSFTYDADQRLSKVYTLMPDANNNLASKLQDSYSYYLHGPLKREEIATNLQGIDYVYTINGALKSMNDAGLNNTYDPGQDGLSTGTHSSFNPDIFGLGIDYFTNDYLRNNSNIQTYNGSSFSGSNNLYAGQIKSVRWNTQLPTGATNINYGGSTVMYEYNYDDKYRLTDAVFGTFADPSGGGGTNNNNSSNTNLRSSAIQFTSKSDYYVNNITYDLNGNIKTLRRYANSPGYTYPALTMDDLTYKYDVSKKNRLLQVSDVQQNTALSNDIDIQDQQNTANYTYNEIGQITDNAQENTHTNYDVYGSVTDVTKLVNHNNQTVVTPLVKYIYNDKGLRAAKLSYDATGNLQTQLNYMYDAAGSLLSTYETNFTNNGASHTSSLKDYVIYGASRLGIYDKENSTATNQIYYYEMNDHVGNTRAVYSANSNGTANVISFTDYYPHGGALPMRKYTGSPTYRYDYQGQEKDAETGLVNFELRQYDPRLGRWFAPDPMGQHHSPYLAMGNNPVSMVDPTGGIDMDAIDGNAVAGGHVHNGNGSMDNNSSFFDGNDAFFNGQFDQNYNRGGSLGGSVNASGSFYSDWTQVYDAHSMYLKSQEEKQASAQLSQKPSDHVGYFVDKDGATLASQPIVVTGYRNNYKWIGTLGASEDYRNSFAYACFGELASGKHNGDDNPYMPTRKQMRKEALIATGVVTGAIILPALIEAGAVSAIQSSVGAASAAINDAAISTYGYVNGVYNTLMRNALESAGTALLDNLPRSIVNSGTFGKFFSQLVKETYKYRDVIKDGKKAQQLYKYMENFEKLGERMTP